MKVRATLESILTFTELEKEMMNKSSSSAVLAVIIFWHILGYHYIDERK